MPRRAPRVPLQVLQFLHIRVQRVQLFTIRLVSDQFFDATYSFPAPPVPAGQPNPLKPAYMSTLARDYELLQKEYQAVL